MPTEAKQFAIDLAKKAGDVIRTNFILGMKKEWKADDTPLTATDLAVNQLVIDAVEQAFPAYSVLAEEGDNLQEGSEFVWVCDPVDGTMPFSHGIPTCVFSLALAQNGESVLGVIYDPFMDRMWVAEKGRGAFLNGKKTSVSSTATLKNSVIGVGYWHGSAFNLFPVVEALKNRKVNVLNVLSITYMAALVASGELVATIFGGAKPHDSAALKVIVEEAGGKVTDLFGKDQRYDKNIKGHLASNGILHDELIGLVGPNVK